MNSDRLSILYLSQMPPSPPRFGAQARMHGLMSAVGRRHRITAVSLVDEEFDLEECRRAMADYCEETVLIPNPSGRNGAHKRALQLRSLASLHSFEHLRHGAPGLQRTLDRVLTSRPFDLVNVEFPYLGHLSLRQAPAGAPRPAVVIDAHEIAHDMVRQFARRGSGLGRKLYGELNWRKLRHEEVATFRRADGVAVCSAVDGERVRREAPGTPTVVVPNAADVDFYRPRPEDPPVDPDTVLFFGLLSTLPNIDGIGWFVREVWPQIVRERPSARLKIYGKGATPEVRALASERVEVVGFVDDLRPHLARAAAVVVPLRLGGGTRLKIVEAMAMGKAVVSTSLGAEGIEAVDGQDILLADAPADLARATLRLLAEPPLARAMGVHARRLAEERYAWTTAAATLERFFRHTLSRRQA